MASQVLSGSSNVSYTNNTGQNVRIVINYMQGSQSGSFQNIAMTWAGASISFPMVAIGRNLAFTNTDSNTGSLTAHNGLGNFDAAFPTEIMLASGQTFSATCAAYNIVIIPEAG